jgi:probable rRNA maturation factor
MEKKLQGEKTKLRVAGGDPFTHPLIHSFNSSLHLINRQRTKTLNLASLRRVTETALNELGIQRWDLTFYFVGAKKMAGLNETHLGHPGPTDVITFDYADHATRNPQPVLHGEIFICVDIAVTQAREFRTTWQAEVIRYLIHGLLHLCGHDDLKSAARREMKRHENRLVRKLASVRKQMR